LAPLINIESFIQMIYILFGLSSTPQDGYIFDLIIENIKNKFRAIFNIKFFIQIIYNNILFGDIYII